MALIFVNRYFYPDINATSQMLNDLAMHAAGTNETVRVITSRQRLSDAGSMFLGFAITWFLSI